MSSLRIPVYRKLHDSDYFAEPTGESLIVDDPAPPMHYISVSPPVMVTDYHDVPESFPILTRRFKLQWVRHGFESPPFRAYEELL